MSLFIFFVHVCVYNFSYANSDKLLFIKILTCNYYLPMKDIKWHYHKYLVIDLWKPSSVYYMYKDLIFISLCCGLYNDLHKKSIKFFWNSSMHREDKGLNMGILNVFPRYWWMCRSHKLCKWPVCQHTWSLWV